MKHNRKKFHGNSDQLSALCNKYSRMQAHDDRGRSMKHLSDFVFSSDLLKMFAQINVMSAAMHIFRRLV